MSRIRRGIECENDYAWYPLIANASFAVMRSAADALALARWECGHHGVAISGSELQAKAGGVEAAKTASGSANTLAQLAVEKTSALFASLKLRLRMWLCMGAQAQVVFPLRSKRNSVQII